MNRKTLFNVKTFVQAGFFTLVALITAAGFMAEQGAVLPSWVPVCLHGICPFGGAATLGRLFTQGLFVPRTGTGNLFSLAAALGGTLLFGAFFCGWICPLGSIQDWFWKLGGKLRLNGRKSFLARRIPSVYMKKAAAADRIMSYLRFAVLGLIIYGTFRSVNLVFAGIDPFYALFHIWTGAAMPLAIALLAAVLAVSLFIYKPWCRWLCPFGAVQGVFSRLAPWTIRKNASLCTDCGACARACLFGINPAEKAAVADSRCSRCLACTAVCPVPGALQLSAGFPAAAGSAGRKSAGSAGRGGSARGGDDGGRLAVSRPWAAAAIVIASFFIPLSAGAAWKNLQAESQSVQNSGLESRTTAQAALISSADEISSAWMLQETAFQAGISSEELLEILEIPADFDLSVKLRDIEDHFEDKTLRWIKSRMEPLFEKA